jgi:putative DNA primase/helicase
MRARDLMPPSWTLFTRNGLEYDYNPEAECPMWLDFLEGIWPWARDNGEMQMAVQEVFGYLLTGDTSFQVLFSFIGPRGSGKGTMNRVLQGLVGEANHVEKSLSDLRSDFALADVVGKSLLTVSDVRLDKGAPTGRLIERILNMTGEDKVGINGKFKDMFTAKINARLVFFGNMDLALPDKAGAIARRLIPFVMTKSFYGSEDRLLTDKLLTELPGILNWALEGLDRLYERGHFKLTKAGEKHLHRVMLKASPVMAFMAECCEDGEAVDMVPVAKLFKDFTSWQVELGVKPWTTPELFAEEVSTVNRLVETERVDKVLCFTRLRMKPEYLGRKWESDESDDDV